MPARAEPARPPENADLDQLRPTVVASLALAAKRNAARGYADVGLFEVGPEFSLEAPEGQSLVAAGLRAGQTPRSWQVPTRPVDAMDAKGDLWAVMGAIGVPLDALQVVAEAPGFFHPGRSGLVRQGPRTALGAFGELHPRVLAALDIPGPLVAFVLNLDAVADPKRRRKGPPDLPAFQPLRRDFAFLADATVPALAVQASGGVSAVADIVGAREADCAGIVLGRALLEGRFALPEALAC